MQARREEEAIIADGPQEQGLCGPWGFGAGPGRNRADAGAQLAEIRGFARPQPQLKRPVFAGEGSKVITSWIKRIAERSLFRRVAAFVARVRPSFRYASQQDDEQS